MKMSLIQKSQGPALGKPFPTLLSSPRFNVIGGDWRLTLCASKLSADGFSNPQDSRIERHAVRRSVVFGRTRSLPCLFLCHADAPSSGSIGWRQRGNPRRKSEIPVIDLRRRNTCRRRIVPSLELAVIRREG